MEERVVAARRRLPQRPQKLRGLANECAASPRHPALLAELAYAVRDGIGALPEPMSWRCDEPILARACCSKRHRSSHIDWNGIADEDTVTFAGSRSSPSLIA
jgi:hypothetical protein